jgi:DNA-binding Lrp family transcriptional regulator
MIAFPNLDDIDARLLGDWQRGLPLVPRPFAEIGASLGIAGAEVIERLERLAARSAISRVGATIRPNTAGASTLAAVAAPEWRVDEVAELIGAEPGVNHSYQRENEWNLWFVATGPDRAHVDATLARIEAAAGLRVLDLPLVRPHHIDLGFALDGSAHAPGASAEADVSALRPGDEEILQGLTLGLDLVDQPYAALAGNLGRSESEIMERIGSLARAGVISRLGIIVRHRALGWRSNAMVVWQVPQTDVDRAGAGLAAQPGVTLCYQRRPHPRLWPYNLYCMIHAQSRDEALGKLDRAADGAGLAHLPHQVLFSLRCYKQTGALMATSKETAACGANP